MKCIDNVYQFNYVVCGLFSVGKSTLCHRYISGDFQKDCGVTIGVDYQEKILEIDNKKIKIHLYDTAGQEKYKAITMSYYRSSDGVLLCFSLNNRRSFYDLEDCLANIKMYTKKGTQMILVGTCKDAKNDREVSQDLIYDFADKNNLEYIEVSALTGEGVEQCFNILHHKLLAAIDQNLIEVTHINNNNINVKADSPNTKSECCVII